MSLSQQMKLKSHSKKSKKSKKKKKKKKKKMSKRTAVTAVTSSLFGASTDEFDGWTATAELSAPMVNGTTNSTSSGVSKKGLNATNTTAAAAASKMKMNTTKVTRSGEFVLFCMTEYSKFNSIILNDISF